MKYFPIPFIGILVSFYFFPTELVFLPGVNTKILMALLGCWISIYNVSTSGGGMVAKPIIELSTYGAAFSLMCFLSTVYNCTSDYAYATYFVSMWVWAIGAFAVCQLIKNIHEEVTFNMITRYLVGVCVGQCIIALLINNIPSFRDFIDTLFYTGSDFYEQGGRLYGIGCALDPAGVRFSVVLVLLANLILNVKGERQNLQYFMYMLSFAVIVIVGNTMARTTIVGTTIALGYIVFSNFTEKKVGGDVWKWLSIMLLITIPLMTILYNTNPSVREDLRFGFEGFFSLVEKGHWETHSNNELEQMVRWPDNMKTWLIGDGYFVSPYATNPYYIGTDSGVFYKNTDIGYCRFIFYCGTLGLTVFSGFFVKVTTMCARLFPKRKTCLFFILMVNFIVWAKVATDIFLVFALLFFTEADKEEEEEDEAEVEGKHISDSILIEPQLV